MSKDSWSSDLRAGQILDEEDCVGEEGKKGRTSGSTIPCNLTSVYYLNHFWDLLLCRIDSATFTLVA